MKVDVEDWWGEPIHVYSRNMAIEDGVLIDLWKVSPSACALVTPKASIAVTASVFAEMEQMSRHDGNDLASITRAILFGAINGKRNGNMSIFSVMIDGDTQRQIHRLKVIFEKGENGNEITIMQPSED